MSKATVCECAVADTLMASAMNPETKVSADNGYIRVLEALSSNDPIIVDFLAAQWRHSALIRRRSNDHRFEFRTALTDGNKTAVKAEISSMREYRNTKNEELNRLFFSLNIDEIQKDESSHINLRRLGLVESIEIGQQRDRQRVDRTSSEMDAIRQSNLGAPQLGQSLQRLRATAKSPHS